MPTLPANSMEFIDNAGTFRLTDPDQSSYLYFPLVNEAGMMSAITPGLHGDIKTGQNNFLTLPVSVEDLHNTRSPRDFWVQIEGVGPWSVAGNSARQITERWTDDADEVSLEAGLLWHKVTRKQKDCGLCAEIINFVPSGDDTLELMRVTLTNSGDRPLRLTPTAAIPLFGRSADNLRDHRHVSSLLNRVTCHPNGVLLRPTMSFDERGHQTNAVTYAVLGATGEGAQPVGFWPVVEDFIGEGGSLDWPQAIVQSLPPTHQAGDSVDGYEALGGLRFPDIKLSPGASQSYVLILAIIEDDMPVEALLPAYGNDAQFEEWLTRTQAFWADKADALHFRSADPSLDGWLRWVAIQPSLRRLFGNSYLPYHDYGRGGRGWRDLWQDILAILLLEGEDVGETLLSHFAGVRLDGSNATIIGSEPGEFKADRNNIPRVWMDHGAWPLLTVRLYIDQSGDLDLLLREQGYFKDQYTHRSQSRDRSWDAVQDTIQRDRSGRVYRGSVLEHLLVQHLTAFYHVGEHNLILLEGADWNDGLDMAHNRGESVAFSAMYAWNLQQLAELIEALAAGGVGEIELADELLPLLEPIDFDSISAKRQRLQTYFDAVGGAVLGQKTPVQLKELISTLRTMSEPLAAHIRQQEWLCDDDGRGWFNGYYDDHGRAVEGVRPDGVRMTLTGQVFALMGGIAEETQVDAVLAAANHYLYEPAIGGYRLNTDFGEVKLDLGRAFGFAFGHKENGAMFSHMAVMFANALYRRGRAQAGWRTLAEIYRQSQDIEVSRMYPGIPEYFSERGRGMYPWLTGSASWLILTMVQEVYGVRGVLGDLLLAPQLTAGQFDADGRAEIETSFAGRRIIVRYHNPQRLQPEAYRVTAVEINGEAVEFLQNGRAARLGRDVVLGLDEAVPHSIDVYI